MCLPTISNWIYFISSGMLYTKVLKWVSFCHYRYQGWNKSCPLFLLKIYNYDCSYFYCRESRIAGPEILFGKTGHDLPIHQIANSDPEVFAAYTAPDGGITSISKLEDRLSSSMQEADHSEDFDFIDLDDFTSANSGSNKRRPSTTDIPSELEYGISK